MDAVAIPSALSRLTTIIDALCRAVAGRASLPKNDRRSETTLPIPLIMAVWTRLRRTHTILQALAARFRAGLLKPPARRAPLAKPRARAAKPALVLPRHFAWLCPLVPCDAVAYGNHLRILLEEPEMQALIAASPHARRILRPTCRMLGIEASVLTPPQGATDRKSAAPCAATPVPEATLPHAPPPPGHAPPPHPKSAGPPGCRVLVPG